ncbi:fimbrillin family protein [Phocaeicola plebeius]|uniref:fimbrillin family protein n=1 Tax=Phocaeicola plebeius TaxID=310297 RepID=UPI0026EC2B35|nr:fimbrillin family protein [Phocaeicola plebeius]
MKNYFAKSSVALMVVSAALASCTQEEIVQNDVPARQALNISVNTQDFVSEDGSRATTGTDENRTTAFVEGDEMGMYVISSDGTVICNNEKFVYNGTAWEAANELYYWKNANYIAYYPYNADLTAQNIITVDDIKTKFAGSADFYTQNTAEAYEKADLMLAEIPKPTDGELEFNLAHQFSMVEINVPVRRYKTTAAQGNFEYTAPVSLTWDTPLKIGENVVDPYSTGKGSFRFIVPSATDLELTLNGHLVYDEGIPVNFGSSTESQSINLASGTCKVYNVTYDKVSSDVVTRDLEVGDYYYSDGTIYPYTEGTVDQPIKDGCIGVIFEVGTGIPDTEWNHGSVLALNNAHPDWTRWGNAGAPKDGNSAGEKDLYEFLSEKMDGYTLTGTFTAEVGRLDCAFNKIKVFGTTSASEDLQKYTAPEGSSGWYMPSAGQLMAVWKGLGGYEVTADNYMNNLATDHAKKLESVKKIQKAIEAGGGTFIGNSGTESDKLVQRWWSTTEWDYNNAWTMEWNLSETANGWSTGFSSKNKANSWNDRSTQAYARPVLSF